MGKQEKGKKPKKALTGLAAALVKSGHLSEKKARDLERGKRKEEKVLGRDGVAEREAARKAELEAAREAQALASRQRDRGRLDSEALERARRVIRNDRDPGFGGRRQWFFVARDRRVLFLELSDSSARLLADGEAGIVESLGQAPEPHTVVTGERARVTLMGVDPELVRFWNRDAPLNERRS